MLPKALILSPLLKLSQYFTHSIMLSCCALPWFYVLSGQIDSNSALCVMGIKDLVMCVGDLCKWAYGNYLRK